MLLNAQTVDALSALIHEDNAYNIGKKMTEKLRELIPRQQFDIPIQAAIGAKIIARERNHFTIFRKRSMTIIINIF